MDKSSRYIKMCKEAREIQGGWNHKTGDIFVTKKGEVLFWVPGKYGALEIKGGFGVTRDDKIITLDPYIWLPRYNQLIETIQATSQSHFRDITFLFYSWLRTPYGIDIHHSPKKLFATNEQMWIAYLMESLYHKIWTEMAWVTVEKKEVSLPTD